MIARIPAIVGAISPAPASDTPISVAEIHTTRRLYLAFAEAVDRPEWVVQFGDRRELSKLDAVLTTLHALLPDMVAHTVAFTRWEGDNWLHVQRGLPGLPWFLLDAAVPGVREWLGLWERASASLTRLQGAVGSIAAWSQELALGQELEDQMAWYRENDAPDPKVIARAEKAVRALSSLGVVRCQWQHGDYCFNNMLVSPDRIGVIDFEEFGNTLMPLHDELSLVFSTHAFMQRHQGAPPLGGLLDECFASGRRRWNLDSASLEGLLWHHLLWRLRQCETRPKRAEMAVVLRRQLTQLCDDLVTTRIAI
jgi:hypothetical protein